MKVLVCLPKDLKRSFLFSDINPFKELHTCFLLVCFIVTFKYLIIYLHIQYPKFIVYPISSVLRKLIVHNPRLLYWLPCQCLFFSKYLDELFILFTVNVCIILIVCITLYVCLYIYYIKFFSGKIKNWN